MHNRKLFWTLGILMLLYVVLRIPGLTLPYHQDEWKNVAAAENISSAGEFYAHPPLFQMIFVAAENLFGPNGLRMLPLIFSVGSALLLYVVVRSRGGTKAGLWALGLFTVCFSNVLGAVVPDVDGSILPFFFLLSVFVYERWMSVPPGKLQTKWFSLLVAVLLVGFLIKLNFILVIGALFLDYVWKERKQITVKKVLIWICAGIGFVGVYIGLLFVIRGIYPAFDMGSMFGHANQFAEGVGRNWIQIAVQGLKSVFYLSPLLIFPLFFGTKEIFRKTRVFWLCLIVGCIFYFILFDFSRGALDKYLMFAIAPFAVMGGLILSHIFAEGQQTEWFKGKVKGGAVFFGIVLVVALVAINFLPHEVLPLYPKSLWFSRVLHGEWMMLNPFNGGSGPLGFYISFLFIALSFIISLGLTVIGIFKRQWRQLSMVGLIIVSVIYNVVFIEELMFGRINGSAPLVLEATTQFIQSHPEITKVITYNDIGAGLLDQMGKYAGRIYATPEAEERYQTIFKDHQAIGGHFLVVGIPPLSSESFYGKFFSKCDSLFGTTSGKVRGDVYICPHESR
jgi:4-amino-4-deoxy-L-arabinose transferase-like glycosyltransferase